MSLTQVLAELGFKYENILADKFSDYIRCVEEFRFAEALSLLFEVIKNEAKLR
jgi:hypothetical protein